MKADIVIEKDWVGYDWSFNEDSNEERMYGIPEQLLAIIFGWAEPVEL